MRKELLWAGVIGILFGLIIAFGAWRVRSTVTQKESASVPSPTPASVIGQLKIAVEKPGNLDVVTDLPMEITGITKPLTWVVVSTDKNDYLTQSGEDGAFSVGADLNAGINNVKAVVINPQGGSADQNLTVVYSSSLKDNLATPEATSSGDEIENSVALKLAQTANPLKAYVGTVTDIIDSTIQIKSLDSQIQQISTKDKTIPVVNTKGTANKTIKIGDVAIGDFIVAMGFIDGNDVLEAKRILVTDSPLKLKITAEIQKVDAVSKKTLSLTPIGGGDTETVTPDKNTVIMRFSQGKTAPIKITEIAKSERVLMVSDTTGSPALLRSIFALGTE